MQEYQSTSPAGSRPLVEGLRNESGGLWWFMTPSKTWQLPPLQLNQNSPNTPKVSSSPSAVGRVCTPGLSKPVCHSQAELIFRTAAELTLWIHSSPSALFTSPWIWDNWKLLMPCPFVWPLSCQAALFHGANTEQTAGSIFTCPLPRLPADVLLYRRKDPLLVPADLL